MRMLVSTLALLPLCLIVMGGSGCGGPSSNLKRLARRSNGELETDADTSAVGSAAKAGADKTAAGGPKSAPKTGPKTVAAKDPKAGPPTAPQAPEETPEAPVASNEKPEGPLTELERRARSIANLEKIGKALAAYAAKRGRFPPPATSDDNGDYLSWRVAILPELGYPELRARFKEERWDSPHNTLLLDYIPPEYQSPERFDVKTNYLGVAGARSLFGSYRGMTTKEIKDGVDNTLAVVEVDDKYALEWTRPADHIPVLEQPRDKLGALRGDGAFGVLANGRVVLLARDLSPSRLGALFTAVGGEPIGAASFLKPPTSEPPPPMLASATDNPEAANQPSSTETAAVDGVAAVTNAPRPLGPIAYVPDSAKGVVPDEMTLAKARGLLKELYSSALERARTPQQRQQFAQKLLADASHVDEDAADYYEMVRIARDLAASLGDAKLALSACELLEQRFQIDPLPMRLAVLQDLHEHAQKLQSAEAALQEARRIAREAFLTDHYELAIPAHELAVGFARLDTHRAAPTSSKLGAGVKTSKLGTPDSLDQKARKAEITRLEQQADMLRAAKAQFTAAERALSALEASPADPDANEAVGAYLCLVKGRWDAGLPYLAKAADIQLRGIASLELATDRSQPQTLSLADQYWELAARARQPQRRGLHLRAVYCYELVAPGLASSLRKAKVEQRIAEAAAMYGQDEIERVLAPLRGNRTERKS
jgi:hypothetical protein